MANKEHNVYSISFSAVAESMREDNVQRIKLSHGPVQGLQAYAAARHKHSLGTVHERLLLMD